MVSGFNHFSIKDVIITKSGHVKVADGFLSDKFTNNKPLMITYTNLKYNDFTVDFGCAVANAGELALFGVDTKAYAFQASPFSGFFILTDGVDGIYLYHFVEGVS